MPEACQLGSVVVVFVVFVDELPVAVVALRYSRAVKLTSKVGVDPDQRNVPFSVPRNQLTRRRDLSDGPRLANRHIL